jgi:hypothetical protein
MQPLEISMSGDAALKKGSYLVLQPGARGDHSSMRHARGGRVALAHWALGAAVLAVVAWLIGNTLLRWVTLD